MSKELKLTKDERFTAYCIMLEEAENKIMEEEYFFDCGLCTLVADISGCRNIEMIKGYRFIEKFLPELSKALSEIDGIWRRALIFRQGEEGWQQRIELLKRCINETHP